MLWYSLEEPHWGASNESHMFSWRKKEKHYVDTPSYLELCTKWHFKQVPIWLWWDGVLCDWEVEKSPQLSLSSFPFHCRSVMGNNWFFQYYKVVYALSSFVNYHSNYHSVIIIAHQSLLSFVTDNRKDFLYSTNRKILFLETYFSHFLIL